MTYARGSTDSTLRRDQSRTVKSVDTVEAVITRRVIDCRPDTDALFIAQDCATVRMTCAVVCYRCRVSGNRKWLRAGKLRPAGHRRRAAMGRRQRRGVRWKPWVCDAVWSRSRSSSRQPSHTVAANSRSKTVTLDHL